MKLPFMKFPGLVKVVNHFSVFVAAGCMVIFKIIVSKTQKRTEN